ncbi:MAG: PEP-CTERM sorting domain-containing protein [Acidobacteria bacterium]|nr:PEP-CTERM sorting domain-containing protein [Acidobacteriota bacterium]MCL5287005.1 PEP-CTERM sorting domain-containing protein [Acidobacteriota bacterium]
MSLKRVVLIAALVALATPAVALADGVTFGFTGGQLTMSRPFVVGSSGALSGGAVTLHYITKMSGNAAFGAPIAPTYGTPPVILPPFTQPSILDNFGTMSFTTGSVIAATATSATFGAGGLVTITSGGNFDVLSGNVVANGTPLFVGFFTGPTTMTQLNSCTGTCDPNTFNFAYMLSGPVSGNIDPSLMSLLGLTGNPGANGFMLQFVIGFVGLTDPLGNLEGGAVSVVVPEPGTLALFGTGLIGVAGFIRRRMKA